MRYKTNILFFISSLVLLAACGFKPIYRNYNDTKISSIKLESIESINGYEISRYLLDTMPQTAEAKYLLKIQIDESSIPAIIRHNSDVVRQSSAKKISYKLIDNQSGKLACSGHFNYNASYNSFLGPYATFIEEEKFGSDTSKSIASEVRKNLLICFNEKI